MNPLIKKFLSVALILVILIALSSLQKSDVSNFVSDETKLFVEKSVPGVPPAPAETTPPVTKSPATSALFVYEIGPTPTTPPPTLAPLDYEKAIFEETNRVRGMMGLKPLARDERLAKAARAHSEDMARREYFDHVSPEGTRPKDRAVGLDIGENIYLGGIDDSAEYVVGGWWASPGHRANILGNYKKLGIGVSIRPERECGINCRISPQLIVTQDFY